MAFSSSSSNIDIDSNGVLSATCQDGRGRQRSSTLDLNQFWGNDDGHLVQGSTNFSRAAAQLRVITGRGFTPVLSVELQAIDPHKWRGAIEYLDNFIGNDNGRLVWKPLDKPVHPQPGEDHARMNRWGDDPLNLNPHRS